MVNFTERAPVGAKTCLIYYGGKAFSAIYLRHPSYERAPFFSPESLETETQVSTFLPEYKIPSLVREGDAAT